MTGSREESVDLFLLAFVLLCLIFVAGIFFFFFFDFT